MNKIEIKALIASNRIDLALKLLLKEYGDDNSIIIFNSKYIKIQDEIRLNLITSSDKAIETSKLEIGLLNYLDCLDRDSNKIEYDHLTENQNSILAIISLYLYRENSKIFDTKFIEKSVKYLFPEIDYNIDKIIKSFEKTLETNGIIKSISQNSINKQFEFKKKNALIINYSDFIIKNIAASILDQDLFLKFLFNAFAFRRIELEIENIIQKKIEVLQNTEMAKNGLINTLKFLIQHDFLYKYNCSYEHNPLSLIENTLYGYWFLLCLIVRKDQKTIDEIDSSSISKLLEYFEKFKWFNINFSYFQFGSNIDGQTGNAVIFPKLKYKNFSFCYLNYCNLSKLDLSDTDFRNATIIGVDFSNSNMKQANFSNSVFGFPNYDVYNLVNFKNCNLEGTNFIGVDLRNTTNLIESINFDRAITNKSTIVSTDLFGKLKGKFKKIYRKNFSLLDFIEEQPKTKRKLRKQKNINPYENIN